jgi:oligoribonuclease
MTDTAPLLARDDANLVWIDLEMTGLVPERDRIIEIAVVVTDPQLTVRIEGPVFAIRQSDAVLAGMDAWNTATHGKSGLTDRVRRRPSTKRPPSARRSPSSSATSARASRRCAATASARTGASSPRRCPRSRPFFHYRNLDVSTLKELARRWKPEILAGFRKAQAHTALADITESIDELAYYREHFLQA